MHPLSRPLALLHAPHSTHRDQVPSSHPPHSGGRTNTFLVHRRAPDALNEGTTFELRWHHSVPRGTVYTLLNSAVETNGRYTRQTRGPAALLVVWLPRWYERDNFRAVGAVGRTRRSIGQGATTMYVCAISYPTSKPKMGFDLACKIALPAWRCTPVDQILSL